MSKIIFKMHYDVLRHKSDTSFKQEKGAIKISLNNDKSLSELKKDAIKKVENHFYSNDRVLDISFKSIKY